MTMDQSTESQTVLPTGKQNLFVRPSYNRVELIRHKPYMEILDVDVLVGRGLALTP